MQRATQRTGAKLRRGPHWVWTTRNAVPHCWRVGYDKFIFLRLARNHLASSRQVERLVRARWLENFENAQREFVWQFFPERHLELTFVKVTFKLILKTPWSSSNECLGYMEVIRAFRRIEKVSIFITTVSEVFFHSRIRNINEVWFVSGKRG